MALTVLLAVLKRAGHNQCCRSASREGHDKMAIQVGDSIPSVTLKHLTTNGMQPISTDEIFKGKKIVLFSVPGAFTPTCSARHLPGFVQHADDFKAKGYEIVCLAVNDPFVMEAWGKA